MTRVSRTAVAAGLLLVALVLAGVVSRFADSDPDGLTKVAEDHGFARTGQQHDGLLGHYGSLTGVLGVLAVLGVAGGVVYAVRRRRPDDEQA
jgi:cobalt/nickel transport protein